MIYFQRSQMPPYHHPPSPRHRLPSTCWAPRPPEPHGGALLQRRGGWKVYSEGQLGAEEAEFVLPSAAPFGPRLGLTERGSASTVGCVLRPARGAGKPEEMTQALVVIYLFVGERQHSIITDTKKRVAWRKAMNGTSIPWCGESYLDVGGVGGGHTVRSRHRCAAVRPRRATNAFYLWNLNRRTAQVDRRCVFVGCHQRLWMQCRVTC